MNINIHSFRFSGCLKTSLCGNRFFLNYPLNVFFEHINFAANKSLLQRPYFIRFIILSAANAGECSIASNTGERGTATNCGESSIAASTGWDGKAGTDYMLIDGTVVECTSAGVKPRASETGES